MRRQGEELARRPHQVVVVFPIPHSGREQVRNIQIWGIKKKVGNDLKETR